MSERSARSPAVTTGPGAGPRLLLAHGAGAPMDSPFMQAFARLAAAAGARVTRFEFDYMAERRMGGGRKPPPAVEKLMVEFEGRIAESEDGPLFIGGKSLGGRVASMIAGRLFAAGRIDGLVCLGYPFHPPGRPERLRTSHLETLDCPALIVQGERDPFGNAGEVAGYRLSPSIGFHWSPFGNHDLVPPKKSGLTDEDNWRAAAAAVARFTTGSPRQSGNRMIR